MENKFTPGPWQIYKDQILGKVVKYFVIYSKSGEQPIVIGNVGNEADARLIATAPELLETLEEIINCPNSVDKATVPRAGIDANREQVVLEYSISLVRIDKARIAISKAKGEQ